MSNDLSIAVQMEAQRIILRNIQRQFKWVVPKGGSVWVCCCLPTHGGRDNTPSLKFNLDPQNPKASLGHCYCFGCGGKMHWNEFAKLFKLETISALDQEVTERSDVRNRLLKISHQAKELTLPEIAEEWGARMLHEPSSEWRGVGKKLLTAVGAKVFVNRHTQKRMLLPVSVKGEMIGGINARWDKSTDKSVPSYLNSEGEWAKTLGLFPYDSTARLMERWDCRKLVLGEGPRDALTGLQNKFPTLALLGVKNWSKRKMDLILSLDPDEIVLCMDSDKAGIAATNMLMDVFDRYCPVSFVNMKQHAKLAGLDKLDLGEATDSVLDDLQEKVYG